MKGSPAAKPAWARTIAVGAVLAAGVAFAGPDDLKRIAAGGVSLHVPAGCTAVRTEPLFECSFGAGVHGSISIGLASYTVPALSGMMRDVGLKGDPARDLEHAMDGVLQVAAEPRSGTRVERFATSVVSSRTLPTGTEACRRARKTEVGAGVRFEVREMVCATPLREDPDGIRLGIAVLVNGFRPDRGETALPSLDQRASEIFGTLVLEP
jgi:hypothetical protein